MSKFGQRENPKTPFHLRWTFIRTKPNTAWEAWIAGSLVWVHGHHVGAHKGCLRILSNDALPCKYCGVFKEREMGYLPVYDRNLKQCVIGIGKDMRAGVERFKLHDPVKIKKGPEKTDPIIVERKDWTDARTFSNPRMQKAQDIEPWCVLLWAEPSITAWYAAQPDKGIEEIEDTEPDRVVTLMTPEKKPILKVSRKKLSEYTQNLQAEQKNRLQELSQADSSSRNGTH